MRSVWGTKRIAAIALSVAVALGAATAIAVPLEHAVSTVAATSQPKPKTPPKPLAMGSFPASKYAAAAAKLPQGLVIAVSRDAHLTAAQYLANAAAGEHAVKVIASLNAAGVHVLGSKMTGTKLTVYVSSTSQASIVKSAGATAVVGKPAKLDFSKRTFNSVTSTDIYGGEGYFFFSTTGSHPHGGSGDLCSIGFNGYAVSNGAPQFVTAGHCQTAIPSGNSVYLRIQSQSGVFETGNLNLNSSPIGKAVSGEGQYGSGSDYGIIGSGNAGFEANNSVATWGTDGHSPSDEAPTSSTPLGITGQTSAIAGETLCKSGSTTGWTCGEVEAVNQSISVSGRTVNSIVATTCLIPGDSGGGAIIGTDAVGIDSGSDFPQTFSDPTQACANPDSDPGAGADGDNGFQSVFFPMVASVGHSVQNQQGTHWQLGVTVPSNETPTISYPAAAATVFPSSVMNGTVANHESGSTAILYLDGSTTPYAKASASTGTWSIPLTHVSSGPHTFTLAAGLGWSAGATVAGNFTMASACPSTTGPSLPTAARAGAGDFNCDGKQDLIARDSGGNLWLYPGNGSHGLGSRVKLVGDWQSMSAIVSVGDMTGDGHPDVVARDPNGDLWLYPGNGSNGFGARIQLGATGAWINATAIQGVGDFDGDGYNDIVARTGDALTLYPGTGSGGLGSPVSLGSSGWAAMTAIVGAGDFNGDGHADLLARDASGVLWLYPGTGAGTLGARVEVASGWQSYKIAAAGDFNRDGNEDLVVVSSAGNLWLYPGNGHGGFLTHVKITTGWSSYTIAGNGSSVPVVVLPPATDVTGGVGDFDGDVNPDIIARDSSGTLWLYPGTGKGGLLSRVQLATGWQPMTAIVSVGDLNNDGKPDVVARDSVGTLWLYPGNGSNGFGSRIQLGAAGGWAGMTAIQGVADFDGDGHVDLLARDSSGAVSLYPVTGAAVLGAPVALTAPTLNLATATAIVGPGDLNNDGDSDLLVRDASGALWFCPGNGSGGVGTPVKVETGFQSYTITAVGDFNHDGNLDIVARHSSGNLWFYPGNGSGGFRTAVEVGSGWASYTLAGSGTTIARVVPPAQTGGVGDFNSDGSSDLILRSTTGNLWMYPGNGKGGLNSHVLLASGWQSKTALVAVGDFDGDGHPDIVAREADGSLSLYSGDGNHGLSTAQNIGPSGTWGSMTLIEGIADFDGDGRTDLLAMDAAGNVSYYPVTGAGVLGTPVPLASIPTDSTAIVGVGDFDGDGKSDLLVRDASGVVSLYPGSGSGNVGAPVQVATGWQTYTIVAAGDFNRDGTEDVVVITSGGNLWLYPGNGHGGFLPKVKLASGWSSYTVAGSGNVIPTS